jgi:toxin ParE1/3/4
VRRFEIFVSPAAANDLEDIWLYIAQENPLAASRVLQKLNHRIVSLMQMPKRTQLRPDIAPTARCLIQGNYLVLYEVFESYVEIVRVVHGSIDLTKLYT